MSFYTKKSFSLFLFSFFLIVISLSAENDEKKLSKTDKFDVSDFFKGLSDNEMNILVKFHKKQPNIFRKKLKAFIASCPKKDPLNDEIHELVKRYREASDEIEKKTIAAKMKTKIHTQLTQRLEKNKKNYQKISNRLNNLDKMIKKCEDESEQLIRKRVQKLITSKRNDRTTK